MQSFLKVPILLVFLSFPQGSYTSVMDNYKDLDTKILTHLGDYTGVIKKKITLLDQYNTIGIRLVWSKLNLLLILVTLLRDEVC